MTALDQWLVDGWRGWWRRWSQRVFVALGLLGSALAWVGADPLAMAALTEYLGHRLGLTPTTAAGLLVAGLSALGMLVRELRQQLSPPPQPLQTPQGPQPPGPTAG